MYGRVKVWKIENQETKNEKEKTNEAERTKEDQKEKQDLQC